MTQAIHFPSEDEEPAPGLSFDEVGPDEFPAYGVHPGSQVRVPATQLLPTSLPTQMSLTVTAKLQSSQGGYLFSVTDPSDKVSVTNIFIRDNQLRVRSTKDNVMVGT